MFGTSTVVKPNVELVFFVLIAHTCALFSDRLDSESPPEVDAPPDPDTLTYSTNVAPLPSERVRVAVVA
jgi:hypothetical protein